MSKNHMWIGAALLGLLVFGGKKLYDSRFKPTAVQGGESVSAKTFRVIAKRRPGLTYVPATRSGNQVTFTAPSSGGTFTRNMVAEGGQLWAELKV